MHFSVAILLFDKIVHSDSTTMKFWRPQLFGHLGQRPRISCLSTKSKGLSSETSGPISFKFHMQPCSKGGNKVYIFRPGHNAKMAATPIYGKKP